MSEQKKATAPAAPAEKSTERRRRRHGYRGYPMRGGAEGVHWGTGFSGVETPGAGSGVLPRAGMLTETSRRDAKG